MGGLLKKKRNGRDLNNQSILSPINDFIVRAIKGTPKFVYLKVINNNIFLNKIIELLYTLNFQM